jgi:hypothetical protein
MRRLLLVLTAVATAAWAQDDDPPSRAARLSYITGTVTFQPGSVEDWVPATLNRPMTTGDRLWTEAGARAEMHIGSAALRMNGRTNFAFVNLDDQTVQVQVSVGSLNVRLRNLADGEVFEVDTPQVALTLLRAGEYRVDVDENGDATIVSVRGGEADATAPSDAITVQARDQVRATGTDQVVFDRRPIPPADAFDNFCEGRDRREDTSQSARYVSRDIPGYADLDGAGAWRESPDYGQVWYPAGLDAGWAPYRYGHWAWISPWGWTWVDDAPWGYAPFHYGRWVYVGGGWGWVPGPVVARPVYAPAMVAWVGGGGFAVGIGVGVGPSVGWFPLGPREVWVPGYRYSPGYIERVNVTNTVIVNRTVINNVNVTNVNYVNRNVAGAVTVMPQGQMVAGRQVRGVGVAATPQMLANARVQNTAAVAPERGAVLGGRQPMPSGGAPPAALSGRQVMARQAPPAAPVPFQQQQARLQQNPGQPIPQSTLRQAPAGAPGGGGPQTPRPAFRQVGPSSKVNQGGGAPGGGGPGVTRVPPSPNTPAPGAVNPGRPGPGQGAPQLGRKSPDTPVASPNPNTGTPAGAGAPRLERRNPTPAPAPVPNNTVTPAPQGRPGPGSGGPGAGAPAPQERTPETRANPTPAPQPAPNTKGGGQQKQNKANDGKRRPPEKDDKGK